MAAASGWAATLFPKDLLIPDFIRDDKDIVAFKGLAMIELRMSCSFWTCVRSSRVSFSRREEHLAPAPHRTAPMSFTAEQDHENVMD
jgi:hypothetical protein